MLVDLPATVLGHSKNFERFADTLERDLSCGNQREFVFHGDRRAGAEQYLAVLGLIAETCRQVDRSARGGVDLIDLRTRPFLRLHIRATRRHRTQVYDQTPDENAEGRQVLHGSNACSCFII